MDAFLPLAPFIAALWIRFHLVYLTRMSERTAAISAILVLVVGMMATFDPTVMHAY